VVAAPNRSRSNGVQGGSRGAGTDTPSGREHRDRGRRASRRPRCAGRHRPPRHRGPTQHPGASRGGLRRGPGGQRRCGGFRGKSGGGGRKAASSGSPGGAAPDDAPAAVGGSTFFGGAGPIIGAQAWSALRTAAGFLGVGRSSGTGRRCSNTAPGACTTRLRSGAARGARSHHHASPTTGSRATEVGGTQARPDRSDPAAWPWGRLRDEPERRTVSSVNRARHRLSFAGSDNHVLTSVLKSYSTTSGSLPRCTAASSIWATSST
jgi:hypothetical protein